MKNTIESVNINNVQDCTKNQFIIEFEYHGDINSYNSTRALSYLIYESDLIKKLKQIRLYIIHSKKSFLKMES